MKMKLYNKNMLFKLRPSLNDDQRKIYMVLNNNKNISFEVKIVIIIRKFIKM